MFIFRKEVGFIKSKKEVVIGTFKVWSWIMISRRPRLFSIENCKVQVFNKEISWKNSWKHMMGSLLLSERQINWDISSNFVALEKLNCKTLKPIHTLGFESLYQDQWSMHDIQWLNSDASRGRKRLGTRRSSSEITKMR